MFKFLINLATLVLSIAILAFGGVMTVQESDFDAIANDFQAALETPLLPEMPDTPSTPGDQPGEVQPGQPGGEQPGGQPGGEQPGEPTTPPTSNMANTFEQLFDTYNPAFSDINQQVISNSITNMLPEDNGRANSYSDVVNTYVDNLYSEIENIQGSTEGATEEEIAQARQEFAERESAAYNGLVEIMTETTVSGTTPNEETVVESVDALLNSTVCLNTVSTVVAENAEITGQIQDATQNLTPETQTAIEEKINEYYNANPENAAAYENLASLFGITLNGAQLPTEPQE